MLCVCCTARHGASIAEPQLVPASSPGPDRAAKSRATAESSITARISLIRPAAAAAATASGGPPAERSQHFEHRPPPHPPEKHLERMRDCTSRDCTSRTAPAGTAPRARTGTSACAAFEAMAARAACALGVAWLPPDFLRGGFAAAAHSSRAASRAADSAAMRALRASDTRLENLLLSMRERATATARAGRGVVRSLLALLGGGGIAILRGLVIIPQRFANFRPRCFTCDSNTVGGGLPGLGGLWLTVTRKVEPRVSSAPPSMNYGSQPSLAVHEVNREPGS